jgi:hypothetical protein
MDDREAHLLIIRSASRISKRRLRNFERTSLALRASPPNLGGDCLKQRILISISAETQTHRFCHSLRKFKAYFSES